jgi:hypothetical protein
MCTRQTIDSHSRRDGRDTARCQAPESQTLNPHPLQIIDDILDVTADSATLGKTAGKDLLVDKVAPKPETLDPNIR